MGDFFSGLLSAINPLFSLTFNALDRRLETYEWQNRTDYANKVNQDNWLMQQDYNSPLNQRLRLEQAGFNPQLAYGGGSVANTANAAPSAPSAPNPMAKGLDFTNSFQALMQAKLIQAQVNQIEENTRGQKIENDYTESLDTEGLRKRLVELGIDGASLDNEGKLVINGMNEEQTEKLRQEIENLKRQYDLTDVEIEKIINESKNLEATKRYTDAQREYLAAKSRREEIELKAKKGVYESQEALNYAKVQEAKAKAALDEYEVDMNKEIDALLDHMNLNAKEAKGIGKAVLEIAKLIVKLIKKK